MGVLGRTLKFTLELVVALKFTLKFKRKNKAYTKHQHIVCTSLGSILLFLGRTLTFSVGIH